ncbi:hypothetical protein CDO41_35630, partial [Pseudomonas aeruginosa]
TTDLNGGALFNAEFGIRHRGSTVPERSGVALSFCRRPAIYRSGFNSNDKVNGGSSRCCRLRNIRWCGISLAQGLYCPRLINVDILHHGSHGAIRRVTCRQLCSIGENK